MPHDDHAARTDAAPPHAGRSRRRRPPWLLPLVPAIAIVVLPLPASATDALTTPVATSFPGVAAEKPIIRTSSSKLLPLRGAHPGSSGWRSNGFRMHFEPTSSVLIFQRRARISALLRSRGSATWRVHVVNLTTGEQRLMTSRSLVRGEPRPVSVRVALPAGVLNTTDKFLVIARTTQVTASGRKANAPVLYRSVALEASVAGATVAPGA